MRIRHSAIVIWISLCFLGIGCLSCSSTSADEYTSQIKSAANKYNSSRDIVDKVIRDIDYGNPPGDLEAFLKERIESLELAVQEMNVASRSLGQVSPPERFQVHQTATLKAWRAGIEATVAMKLYVEKFSRSGQIDNSLVIQANRLFGEEDQYQLEARNAMRNLLR